MTAMAALIEARGLHAYYGSSHVLRGVDFHVAPGETVGLFGRNGMGKTTLLRTLLGHVSPRRGAVHIRGVEVTGLPPEKIARQGVGYVPEGRGVFPNLTVRENLIMAARFGVSGARSWTLERVLSTFPRLAARLSHRGDQLSGGEQQMLAIGRALLSRPKLMLMDEPSLGLSPLLTQEIFRIIVRINREQGTTILLVEQNANMALEVGDHGYVLEVGRIVMEDTCQRLAQNKDVQEFYLGMKSHGVRGQRRWKKKKQWR